MTKQIEIKKRKKSDLKLSSQGTKRKKSEKSLQDYGTPSGKQHTHFGNPKKRKRNDQNVYLSNNGWKRPKGGEWNEHPHSWGSKDPKVVQPGKGYTEIHCN